MLPYFPPKSVFTEALGVDLSSENLTERVSVTVTVLRLLIRSALAGAMFDQDYYLKCNPDLEVAWKAGLITNLRQHFIENGYFEGRKGTRINFDEKWYLNQYRDVALALREGEIDSGQQHYELLGEKEWRAPNEAASALTQEWRVALAYLAR